MKVLIVTSTGRCGIAAHSEMMGAAIEAADPDIQITLSAEALDPHWALGRLVDVDWLWLNHHDALHSRWLPEHVERAHQRSCKVGVTYHDSRSGGPDDPNPPKAKALLEVADVLVVHEPVQDLPGAVYLRQGVHAGVGSWQYGGDPQLAYPTQPVLGTLGFNQGWREFDRLAEVTAACGWALSIMSCNATAEDEARWRGLNPHLFCLREWVPTVMLVKYLAGCDATCWVHACGNAGTSGTIRLGLAARKPLIAFPSRQYTDLRQDPEARAAIFWCPDFGQLPLVLSSLRIQRVDPAIAAIAHRDSWKVQGQKYAALLRGESL